MAKEKGKEFRKFVSVDYFTREPKIPIGTQVLVRFPGRVECQGGYPDRVRYEQPVERTGTIIKRLPDQRLATEQEVKRIQGGWNGDDILITSRWEQLTGYEILFKRGDDYEFTRIVPWTWITELVTPKVEKEER